MANIPYDKQHNFNKQYFMKIINCVYPGSDDDLEYYVRECGDILGVTHHLPQENRTAKHILEHVFTQIVEFKKLNQVREMDLFMYPVFELKPLSKLHDKEGVYS